MDEICMWLEKLILWVDRCGVPPIPFIGRAGGSVFNPPAKHLELVYLFEGEINDLQIGKKRYHIPNQHVTLYNVHHGNYLEEKGNFKSWCVFFDVGSDKTFKRLESAPMCSLMPFTEPARLIKAFERFALLCHQYGRGPRGYLKPQALLNPATDLKNDLAGKMLLKSALLELLGLLLEQAQASIKNKQNPMPEALRDSVEFMRLNFSDETLDLDALAKTAGLSANHFGRLFRKHQGETPLQFLAQIRIQQARFLLEHTEMRVEEVGYEVGYKDPFHFSRVFRRILGDSPKAFRQMRRGSK